MIFGMMCLICHINLPAKNEQNLPCGSRDNHLATAVATSDWDSGGADKDVDVYARDHVTWRGSLWLWRHLLHHVTFLSASALKSPKSMSWLDILIRRHVSINFQACYSTFWWSPPPLGSMSRCHESHLWRHQLHYMSPFILQRGRVRSRDTIKCTRSWFEIKWN